MRFPPTRKRLCPRPPVRAPSRPSSFPDRHFLIMDADDRKAGKQFHFDRHSSEYRHQFDDITSQMQGRCPVAWTDTYDGHWVAAGNREVFDLARSADVLSNDH